MARWLGRAQIFKAGIYMREPKVVDIRLSPLARLYFTLDRELNLDKSLVSDASKYDRIVKMLQIAEAKRDALLRSLMMLDALTLLLIFGKNLTIPGIGLSLAEIPAAREAVTVLASAAFQFLSLAQLNLNCYSAFVDVISQHRARETGVDPDILSAFDKFQEFSVKLYRSKINIHTYDFAEPGTGYKVLSFL